MVFKIGDKVKCIEHNSHKLTFGAIYIVLDPKETLKHGLSGSSIWTYVINDANDFNGYHHDCFELVITEIDYLQIAKDVCGV